MPAGPCAAMYSSPLASAGASSVATAVAMFAFIHFWVGHWGCPFSPHANALGAAPGGEMLVTTGVAGSGAAAVGVGVGVAVTVAVAVAIAVAVAVAVAGFAEGR